MNLIFCLLFLLSSVFLLVASPDAFLPALLSGGEKVVSLLFVLLSSYTVWMGFFQLIEDTGLGTKMAKLFKPVLKRLFETREEKTLSLISSNLSANLLGLAAATPLGIQASRALFSEGKEKDLNMLFVVNATSLQLLPTTVFSLRIACGSSDPYCIFLPTLLTTLFSTALGILAVKVFYR